MWEFPRVQRNELKLITPRGIEFRWRKKMKNLFFFFFRGLPTAGIPPFSLTSIVILSNQFQFQFSAEILSIISTPIVSNQNKSEK